MKTIELPDKELRKMLAYYEREYAKNYNKLEKLKSLIASMKESTEDTPSPIDNEKYIVENKITPLAGSSGSKKQEKKHVTPIKKETPNNKNASSNNNNVSQLSKKDYFLAQPAPFKAKLPSKPENRTQTIVNLLQKEDTPLSSNDFVFYIMRNFNVNQLTAKQIRIAIEKLLNDMVFKNHILMKQYIPSENTHYYGLKEWFQKDNILTMEYRKKLEKRIQSTMPGQSASTFAAKV